MASYTYEPTRKRYDLIVLDLDNTLVHTEYSKSNNATVIKLDSESPYRKCYVHKRPGFDYFLQLCFKFSDVGVWSTGTKDYVNNIVKLFPGTPKFVFSREDCHVINGRKRKSLDEIPRRGKTVMIDDRSDVLTEKESVDTLVVPPWFYHKTDDTILYNIIPLLFGNEALESSSSTEELDFEWIEPMIDTSTDIM